MKKILLIAIGFSLFFVAWWIPATVTELFFPEDWMQQWYYFPLGVTLFFFAIMVGAAGFALVGFQAEKMFNK